MYCPGDKLFSERENLFPEIYPPYGGTLYATLSDETRTLFYPNACQEVYCPIAGTRPARPLAHPQQGAPVHMHTYTYLDTHLHLIPFHHSYFARSLAAVSDRTSVRGGAAEHLFEGALAR